MSTTVFLVVLLAAVLHAGWNAVIKGARDRAAGMVALVVGQGACGLALLAFVPFPGPEAYGWLAVSLGLHLGYQLFLTWAYGFGDLGQVYPIARGTAPALVTVVSLAWLDAPLGLPEIAAIALISGGVIGVGLAGHRRGLSLRGPGLALVVAVFIAGYSLADGLGARASGAALGYWGLLAALNAAATAGSVALLQPALLARAMRQPVHLTGGAAASFLAYLLPIWAFTQAPIALVAALRESSILVAVLIGWLALGERVAPTRAAAALAIVAGLVLLRATTAG